MLLKELGTDGVLSGVSRICRLGRSRRLGWKAKLAAHLGCTGMRERGSFRKRWMVPSRRCAYSLVLDIDGTYSKTWHSRCYVAEGLHQRDCFWIWGVSIIMALAVVLHWQHS